MTIKKGGDRVPHQGEPQPETFTGIEQFTDDVPSDKDFYLP